MILSLYRNVRRGVIVFIRHPYPCHLDFRHKFGALHQTFTPSREREIFSTVLVWVLLRSR